jgi:peptidyl-prolyl cis-trans isomerase A (cyclophilin A)
MSNNNNINEAVLPIVINPIADINLKQDTADTTINLFETFDDPSTTGKVARFELYNTSLGGGVINVLLFDQAQTGAPLTVQNFINYASGGDYINSIIHRSVKDFIIQGGGFIINNLNVGNVPADPPVNNEFSVDRSNLRGTIAMAKLGGNPNSATNQWFFNLNNNAANLDNQNGGFTVFGQVLSQTDLNVIDAIAALPVSNLSNVNPAFNTLPVISSPIDSDDDLVRFKSITVGNTNELTFSIVSNSNPNLVNATINNNQLFLDYGTERSGTAEIKIRATNLLGVTIEDTFIVANSLIKTSDFKSSISGFDISFDRQIKSELINLYDGGDTQQDSSDLEILDANNQGVRGSLILDSDTNTLSFIKTGRSLQNGNFTVNLFSRDDSFVAADEGILDGNNDGIAGGNYTNNLTVDNNNLKILELPDFSRAPKQPVNLDPENSRGIPIGLNDGSGVTQLEFTLTYDADLLGINGVNLAANLVDSWQIIEQDFSTAGIVKINVRGNTSLNAGENDILSITATVPETATYGASTILKLKDIKINGSSEGTIGDYAVQHVALLGDISGNGEITSLDAALSARIALGLDSGSDRFANIDPIIFGDSNFDRNLNDLDAATIAKNAVGLIV